MAPIVMITRPEPEATALSAQLAGQGARLLVSPLQQIRFHAITLPEAPFDAIFTSRNGANLKVFVLARIVENFRKSAKNVGTVTK